MTDQSTIEWDGIRYGILGSAADLVVAAPLAVGDPDAAAHTSVNRIGTYFDRTVSAEKVGFVVMGVDVVGVYADKLTILGNESWHVGNLPTPEDQSNKSAANGYASLDGAGKVPLAELPSSIVGGLTFQGMWNATTNTPALASGVGTEGYFYIVSVAGTTSLDGIADWEAGDWAVFANSVWNKVDNSESYLVKASSTDASPGFLDAKVDGTTIQVNGSDQLEVIGAGVTIPAANVAVTAAGFTGVLSPSDTDAQIAFATLDQHTHAIDDLSDVTYVASVPLLNASAVTVDSTTSGAAWKWWILIYDGTSSYEALEISACLTGATTVDVAFGMETANITHTFDVTYTGGTVTLKITADGANYSATARRVYLP